MTPTQLLIMTATIYLAPHLPKWLAFVIAMPMIAVAFSFGLGVFK